MSINPFIKISKEQRKSIEKIIRDFCKKNEYITPRTKNKKGYKHKMRKRTPLELYNLLSDDKKVAFEIAKLYQVEICSYCNENYAYVCTSESDDGPEERIFRPDFDHYYCKAKGSSKALNVYNLVPSCQVCNSRIKGTKSNDRAKYYHPFFDNLFDDFDYIINVLSSNYVNDFNIDTVVKKDLVNRYSFKEYHERDDYRRAKRTIEFFYLKERANHHKQEISSILSIAANNSIHRILNLQDVVEQKDIIRAVFPYYECDIKKTSLGKLKKNVTEYVMKKMGIIK